MIKVTESVFAWLGLRTARKKVKSVGSMFNGKMTASSERRDVAPDHGGVSSKRNGSAERLNRTLEEKGRAMLEAADLWAEVMKRWSRLSTPMTGFSRTVHGKPGWEMFF